MIVGLILQVIVGLTLDVIFGGVYVFLLPVVSICRVVLLESAPSDFQCDCRIDAVWKLHCRLQGLEY